MKKQLFSIKINSFVLSASLGLLFAAGITFAWNAVWHGTDWMQPGNTINSKEIAENFEYLKRKVSDLENKIENSTTTITVANLPAGVIIAGCDLMTKIEQSNNGIAYNCWGGASAREIPRGWTRRKIYKCPPNSYKVFIQTKDTTGSHLAGGDGAQYVEYESTVNSVAFLCIKQ